jgi:hypothetical protein
MVFEVVERTIASLLKDIVGNVQQIIRAEVRLAKAEVAEELAKAGRAIAFVAVGAIFCATALAFLLLGATYLLAYVVPLWVAAVLVAVGSAAIGGLLIFLGARQFKLVSVAPSKTITSVQENIQWAKAQAR